MTNIRKPIIVATVRPQFNDFDDMENINELIKCGIYSFRFNISKFNDINQLSKYLDYLQSVRKHFGDQITITIDTPFPGKKPRLYFDKEYIHIDNNEEILLNSSKRSIKAGEIYIHIEKIGCKLEEGQKAYYSDGEGEFIVQKILDNEKVVLKSLNSFVLYSNKSLYFGYIDYNYSISQEIVNKILNLEPDNVAFSFIDNYNMILKIKESFKNDCINYISKIETATSVKNLRSILCESDIMIGRGDLFHSIDYCNLYNIQRRIANMAHESNSKLYIATGIMSSLLNTNSIPQLCWGD